jgi:hypothetical protein
MTKNIKQLKGAKGVKETKETKTNKSYNSKESVIKRLLEKAHEHFTIESLCEGIGILLASYYKHTEGRDDVRKEVNSKLAKRFTMSKRESNGGNLVTIEITYEEAKRARTNYFTTEERERFVELVCYAYEMGVSVLESCTAIGLHQSTFFKWINPDSPIAYKFAADRFKLAKETRQAAHNEMLSFTARTSLMEKLTERKITNTTEVYEIKGGDETPVLKERRVTDKTYMPEMSAIALTLNNLDVDFRKATAGGQMIQDEHDMREMDEDSLQALLNEEKEKGRALRGDAKGNDNGGSTH